MPAAFKFPDAIPGHPKSPTSAYDTFLREMFCYQYRIKPEKVNFVKN
jgi:hypothetical protein